MLSAQRPVVLLQHGGLDNLSGKTGLAMLRYRSGPIVAVIDPAHAGVSLEAVTGIQRSVPVVADLEAALAYGPEVAVVGLAPSGGRLPLEMRRDVVHALRARLSLASGLHSRLADDPEFAAVALAPGQWIWDLRHEPPELDVATARSAALPCRRVLAVGSDMAVGKMSACLELQSEGQRQGRDVRFVGTGQAGILISGQGVALDAVRVDYAAGAVEAAVLTAAEGHVGADRQHPPAGQGRRTGCRHIQLGGLMAQIPNPLPRGQGDGRELRVIRQTAVQTTGQAQSRPQGVDHIAAHLQR